MEAKEVAKIGLEYGWLMQRLAMPDFDAEDKIQRSGRTERAETLKAILKAEAGE